MYSVVAVGNTTMSHLFLGVDPKNLSVAPFIPCYRRAQWSRAAGWGCPCIRKGPCMSSRISPVMWAPIPFGVAMATKLWEQKGYSLAVDIGTNGEIILGYKGWLLACSAAAGPLSRCAYPERHEGGRRGH